jgi:hypothetical protein
MTSTSLLQLCFEVADLSADAASWEEISEQVCELTVNGISIYLTSPGRLLNRSELELYFTADETSLVCASARSACEDLGFQATPHRLQLVPGQWVESIRLDFSFTDEANMLEKLVALIHEVKKRNLRSSKYYDASVQFPDYPPAFYKSEKEWTQNRLSQEHELHLLLQACHLDQEVLQVWTEYACRDGRRIDLVLETRSRKLISIEAMSQNGLCDEEHFLKGVETFPKSLGKRCLAALLIAAEFTRDQVNRCTALAGQGYLIKLVTARQVEGQTEYFLEWESHV